MMMPPIQCRHALDAPIWMADQTFKAAGAVVAGDEVVGWARPNGKRGLVKSTVLGVSTLRSHRVVRATLASGRRLECSEGHRWLSAHHGVGGGRDLWTPLTTRHGAGPMPTESADWAPAIAHDHNVPGPWQGALRAGPLDMHLLRYALGIVGGVDGLCITNLDRLAALGETMSTICLRYDRDAKPVYTPFTRVPQIAATTIALWAGYPLAMTSTGPTHLEKSWTGGV